MIAFINVENHEEYYRKLNLYIQASRMWNTLQSKSEIGLGKSEQGYQRVASIMAGIIARELGLDAELTECLVMCQGAFFPAYGTAGKKIVLEYMSENNMEMSEADLARNFVEYELSKLGNDISIDFDQKLRELFAVDDMPQSPEVQVARFCKKNIDSIKQIEMHAKENQNDLLYELVKDVKNNCVKAGKLVESKKVQELLIGTSKTDYQLSDDKRDEIYGRIARLSRIYKREKMAGVYEYIGAGI